MSPTVHLDCSDWIAQVPGASAMQGEDFFVPWLAVKRQEPMTIAWVNRSQQLLQHVYKIP